MQSGGKARFSYGYKMFSITPILAVGVLGFGHSDKAFDSCSGGRCPVTIRATPMSFRFHARFISIKYYVRVFQVGHFTATGSVFNDTVFRLIVYSVGYSAVNEYGEVEKRY